jgi:predicted GH43/DUF377 family glycosyl hydrolase
MDEQGVSSLGHATTTDGERILTRSVTPVFSPSEAYEEYGCEDPRITSVDGTYYVFYTAYSRRGPRMAFATTSDFADFDRHGVVGPDCDDKNWSIFPERIGGKVALIHRVSPKIQVDFFDDIADIRSANAYWTEYARNGEASTVMKPLFDWEKKKIGMGPPPIRTEDGWLIIYHGVSPDSVYRAGAVLLDLENPRRVIARLPEPILEPEEHFEKTGVVPNVVFPTGAVVTKDRLKVFYGGADRVCCLAEVSMKLLTEDLLAHS